jgi:hypothetical protein
VRRSSRTLRKQALLGSAEWERFAGAATRGRGESPLKVISPARVGDPDLRRPFELEARAASVLNHPSIVTIYDVGETEGIGYSPTRRATSAAQEAPSTRSNRQGGWVSITTERGSTSNMNE